MLARWSFQYLYKVAISHCLLILHIKGLQKLGVFLVASHKVRVSDI